MVGSRRSAVAVEAERRAKERHSRLGGEIRRMRVRRRWTQAELARRAGIGRLVVGRAERGVGPLDIEILERIGIALGVSLAVGFGRDMREDVADAGHLAVQEIVLRLTRQAGFETQFELPTRPNDPWRSIDVAIGTERQQRAVAIECWNTFGDLGAATRSSRRKKVELEAMALARWGDEGKASLVWVVRESARNRELIGRYPEVFARLFTGSSRAWVETLTNGTVSPDEDGLVWCDVATGRLHAWNRRARGSGS
jgi:transcriptional regulator with XRE-family HTH domain